MKSQSPRIPASSGANQCLCCRMQFCSRVFFFSGVGFGFRFFVDDSNDIRLWQVCILASIGGSFVVVLESRVNQLPIDFLSS